MSELERFEMVIGGKPVDAVFESQNPYTERSWAVLPDGGPDDVDLALRAARTALEGEWGALTGFARAALLRLRFGGLGLSGIGRERGSGAIGDYLEDKAVRVARMAGAVRRGARRSRGGDRSAVQRRPRRGSPTARPSTRSSAPRSRRSTPPPRPPGSTPQASRTRA